MATTAAGQETGPPDAGQFRAIVAEWHADHSMFAATLEELAGQLAILEPQDSAKAAASNERSSSIVIGGDAGRRPPDMLQRLAARAPSECLQTYMRGARISARLQRQLPEQLDQNLRLLTVLAAEMRGFLRQLERLADAAATALLQLDEVGTGSSGPDSDEALLLAAVADCITKETLLIEKAAEGVTLTTPAEEVSAAAIVLQLAPHLDSTLLAALRQSPE
ncbi:hypothetical protein D9Q98_001916 [Chlorella vulgaris]|uniref:Uncharacterized protein n=1 Tax=Chlorella vulgaris TaxID=3077 RepID=A0A9D4TVF1_CHLVU|nr:hypothetical protein D9Q98_001916 [Chlorella vulgaris]